MRKMSDKIQPVPDKPPNGIAMEDVKNTENKDDEKKYIFLTNWFYKLQIICFNYKEKKHQSI